MFSGGLLRNGYLPTTTQPEGEGVKKEFNDFRICRACGGYVGLVGVRRAW